MTVTTERSKTRVKGFENVEMDFQLLRQLGACTYGGASVGECLAVAQRIQDGIPESWVKAFASLASKEKADAEERDQKGHQISAREQFLRACNSYRAAEYFTDFRKPLHRKMGMKSRECFIKSMKLMEHTCEVIEIPFEGKFLPAYFMAPISDAGVRKTLMIVSGYDGTLEESYFQYGKAALQRGYNILLFVGPGQMDCLRFHLQMTFQPDFETPVKAVVDYVLGRPELDAERLALLGISFGGYFSTRAAAHERRIKALVLNSPIIDLHAYMSSFVGFDPAQMPDEQDFGPADMDQIPDEVMSVLLKKMASSMIGRFGRSTFKSTYQYMMEFKVGEALKNIACPCLALVGTGEGEEPRRQFDAFCEQVSGKVASHIFTQEEGADSHCQVGNMALSSAVVLDWLDELFSWR
jgi:pimeloyl-ACP methyl ester carboxylesterase